MITTVQDFDPNKIILTKSLQKDFIKFSKQCVKKGYSNIVSKLRFQNLIKEHIVGRDENRDVISEGYELDIFGQLYYVRTT